MGNYIEAVRRAAKTIGISLREKYRIRELDDFLAEASREVVEQNGVVLLKDWVAEVYSLGIFRGKTNDSGVTQKIKRIIDNRPELGIKMKSLRDALGEVYGSYDEFEIDLTALNEDQPDALHLRRFVHSTSPLLYTNEQTLEEKIRGISMPEVLCRVRFVSDF